ncbi:unnamed protein product [Agarophyton chilense]
MAVQTAFTASFPGRLGRKQYRASTCCREMPRASLKPPTQSTFASLFPSPEQAMVLTPQGTRASLIDHVNMHNADGEVVLLGWLRHFGCTLCKKQANDWKSILPKLREQGPVNVVLVGNGPATHAKEFQEEIGWDSDLYTDPDRRTYKALNMEAGVLTTFNLPALMKTISSFGDGNKQTWSRMPTDAFQQGGALLVDTLGTIRMFHVDHFAGDHVARERIVDQVTKVAMENRIPSE